MWVLAFERRLGEVTYDEFVERYHAFLSEDIVDLCGDHHEEIHTLYWDRIYAFARTKGISKMLAAWTYAEANSLMDHLREVCRGWLEFESPGVRLRKYTGRD